MPARSCPQPQDLAEDLGVVLAEPGRRTPERERVRRSVRERARQNVVSELDPEAPRLELLALCDVRDREDRCGEQLALERRLEHLPLRLAGHELGDSGACALEQVAL